MTKWIVVTNGKFFRIQNESNGEFYLDYLNNPFGILAMAPRNFFTYEQARTKRNELEQKEKDNIWVPVDDKQY